MYALRLRALEGHCVSSTSPLLIRDWDRVVVGKNGRKHYLTPWGVLDLPANELFCPLTLDCQRLPCLCFLPFSQSSSLNSSWSCYQTSFHILLLFPSPSIKSQNTFPSRKTICPNFLYIHLCVYSKPANFCFAPGPNFDIWNEFWVSNHNF